MLHRGQVAQREMQSYLIRLTVPLLNGGARLKAVAREFHAQTFLAKPAVDALVGAVMPRLARLRQRHLQSLIGRPLEQPRRDELRAVVRAKCLRRSALADQAAQDLDAAPRADAAHDVDRQRRAGVLMDQGQA